MTTPTCDHCGAAATCNAFCCDHCGAPIPPPEPNEFQRLYATVCEHCGTRQWALQLVVPGGADCVACGAPLPTTEEVPQAT